MVLDGFEHATRQSERKSIFSKFSTDVVWELEEFVVILRDQISVMDAFLNLRAILRNARCVRRRV